MEKLIELFKAYVDNYGTDTHDLEKEYGVIDDGQGFLYGTREYLYEVIISKKFGFIKWLVENDKIDFREDFYLEDQHGGGFGEDENIIMLLAIQDEPINFLISILK